MTVGATIDPHSPRVAAAQILVGIGLVRDENGAVFGHDGAPSNRRFVPRRNGGTASVDLDTVSIQPKEPCFGKTTDHEAAADHAHVPQVFIQNGASAGHFRP